MEIRVKHLIHCVAFMAIIWSAIKMTLNVEGKLYPGNDFSWPVQIIIYFLMLVPLAMFPVHLSMMLGLLLCDCFPPEVQLKAKLRDLPTICFRVVTRGSFPKLILKNLKLNLKICEEVQLQKYVIEIVTETLIPGLEEGPRVKHTIVPHTYRTTKGTLFKARNLQYALEKSELEDDDWIVHLDEDTVLTSNSVKGVCNFVSRKEHPFGIGPINPNAHGTVGLLTESLDIYPLFDYGILRFDARFMNRTQYIFRSTFMVANVGAEKRVTFEVEGGPSLLEDIAFGLLMRRQGFSFGAVEGNVLEQSAANITDVVNSRARILRGYFHIWFNSSYYSLVNFKIFTIYSVPFLMVFPMSLPYLICDIFFPVYLCQSYLYLKGFSLGFTIYGQIFIVLKNNHKSLWEYIWRAGFSVIIGPPLSVFIFWIIYIRAYQNRNRYDFYNTKKIE